MCVYSGFFFFFFTQWKLCVALQSHKGTHRGNSEFQHAYEKYFWHRCINENGRWNGTAYLCACVSCRVNSVNEPGIFQLSHAVHHYGERFLKVSMVALIEVKFGSKKEREKREFLLERLEFGLTKNVNSFPIKENANKLRKSDSKDQKIAHN